MPKPSRVLSVLLRPLACAALLATSVLLPPSEVRALPVSGQLAIVNYVFLTAGGAAIEFGPADDEAGSFLILDLSSGHFSALSATHGELAYLDASPAQVGTPIAVPSFVTFLADPATVFALTFLHPGAFSAAECAAAPAAGQVCTPTTSPALQLTNVPNGFGIGSTLSFSVSGTVTNGADVSLFTGTFTAPFLQPFQEVLATLAGGGTVASPGSALLEVVVPEPATGSLLALGMLLLARARRRAAWARARPAPGAAQRPRPGASAR